MAILTDKATHVMVQGITGREASSFTRDMMEYGTKVVAGVTPGKGNSTVHGIPVYDTVSAALQSHRIDASVISVPPAFAKNAVLGLFRQSLEITDISFTF